MIQPCRTFVGFGFGAIQGGLFLYEAFRARKFARLVVAEVDPELVHALRRSRGRYRVNIAAFRGVESHEVAGIEILDVHSCDDRRTLASALEQASEIATALPSVDFYQRGCPSVVDLLAEAVLKKIVSPELPRAVVYTAENNNQAAELLKAQVEARELELRRGVFTGASNPEQAGANSPIQFLNTVIGKMSGVVTTRQQIEETGLDFVAAGLPRAFLVEEFNQIFISKITLPDFERGIEVFIEKPDLLPFEEAKLYGHNAVHALIGYLARCKGYDFISDAADDALIRSIAREALLKEAGAALIKRHQNVDALFRADGFTSYAEDLLRRMCNPFLRDRTERIIRDTRRKLSWDDRLIGAMRLTLDAGIQPQRLALGAAAALDSIGASANVAEELCRLWPHPDRPVGRKAELVRLITAARGSMKALGF